MTNKIKIEKHVIGPKTHKLQANWSVEPVIDDWFVGAPVVHTKPVSEMTEEEKADEIIRRLATPPKSKEEYNMDALMSAIAEETKREIDNEMLKKLREIHAKDRS
jgi:uncharacterized protein (DUF2267 family)